MDSISKLKMATFFFLILLRSSDPYPIKTIVVLVMENRSFDHMIGWMKQINPEIDGVDGTESNRISATDALSRRVPFKRDARFVDADPGHSFQAIREQIFGSNSTSADPPPMNGFAQNACSMKCSGMPEEVMSGFDPDMVPVYRALVAEFAVFDRWFAACPASTQPNRMFVHSATSSGAIGNVPKLLAEGYPQRTIFDSLDDDGRSFAIYYQNIPATLFFRNMRVLRRLTRFRPYNMFRRDAARGVLPEYVVVEQRYLDMKTEPANDDHPSHDVYEGQKLVKELYETLRSSPQWNETLMIITYDEHGGFFDHVATPMHGVPSPDGIMSSDPFFFNFDRLGVRVPTIMVSPWIDKGTVVHEPEGRPFPTSQFEHSSIPATVKKIFNLSSSFLTRRDEWAGTFDSVVRKRDRVRTDCPEVLPAPVRLRKRVADENAVLSEFQHEMVQLAAVLKGDHLLAGFPDRGLENMTVKEAKVYTDGALRRFFEAGRLALRMGVDGRQKLQMRPSLTTRLPVESTGRP